MGKTLTNILAVSAAIAVNAIPGVGQALSAAIGASLATSVIAGITIYGLQAGASLLGLGPGAPKPDTTETAIKTSRPPRVSAYGRSRLYGAYCLYETAPDGTAVDVFAVHEGKIDAIETYYLGDEPVTLTGSVVNEGADGRYRDGAVNVYSTDGSVPGAGFPAITALLPGIWTAAHRGDGLVALALTAKSVKSKNFQETYPQTAVPTPSIVSRWQTCPDPAAVDPLDESGWTWTENPVRHLLHYKLVREGPRPALPMSDPGYAAALADLRAAWWARNIAPTLQSWIDAAADCDSAIPLKAGGTEAKYRSSVAHKHTDEHKGPVANILATFDGWMSPRADGALVVYSGKYVAPDPVADLIGPDEIVSYSWEGGAVDDDTAVNEIVCSYISAEHDYNTVECDPWRDESDISNRGRVLSAPLEVQIPSHGQARRLAKRKMSRALSVARGTCTTNIAGRHVRGKRFIWLRLAEAGVTFYEGPAEIISMTRALRGGVSFQWVAADPNIDAWNPATEEGEPAAVGDRVAPQPLPAPTIEAAAALFSDEGVRLQLDVEGPDRDDLTWYVHWREQGAGTWGPDEEYTDTVGGALVTLVTGIVPTNTVVEAQVSYQTGDGRFSGWSATETIDTSTAAVAPGPVTNLSATNEGGEGDAVALGPTPTDGSTLSAGVLRMLPGSFEHETLIQSVQWWPRTTGSAGYLVVMKPNGDGTWDYHDDVTLSATVTGLQTTDVSAQGVIAPPGSRIGYYTTGNPRIAGTVVATDVWTGDALTADNITFTTANTRPQFRVTGVRSAPSISVRWRNPTSLSYDFTRVYRGTSTTFGAAVELGDYPGGLGAIGEALDYQDAGTYYYWARAYSAAGVGSALVGPVSVTVT